MPAKEQSYHREYIARRRERALAQLTRGCEHAESAHETHAHHIRPTGLMGRGRGNWQRLRDIEQHRDCYVLLCARCHRKLHQKDGF